MGLTVMGTQPGEKGAADVQHGGGFGSPKNGKALLHSAAGVGETVHVLAVPAAPALFVALRPAAHTRS